MVPPRPRSDCATKKKESEERSTQETYRRARPNNRREADHDSEGSGAALFRGAPAVHCVAKVYGNHCFCLGIVLINAGGAIVRRASPGRPPPLLIGAAC